MNGRYRCLTAPGAGALQVWELHAAPDLLAELLGGPPPAPQELRVVRIPSASGELLDEGVVAGQGLGRCELALHGGPGVAAAWRERLEQLGWKAAAPPTPAPESAAAPSEDAAEAAFAFTRARSPFAARRAWRAAHEPAPDPWQRAQAEGATAAANCAAQLLPWEDWMRAARGEARVVLAGPSNAGKSSLLNAWVRSQRVTVSPHPGTTRDAVEVSVLFGVGVYALELSLVDTAGTWANAAGVDAAAVAATEEQLRRAWRILWLVDASQPCGPEHRSLLDRARPGDLLLATHADRGLAPDLARFAAAFPGRDLGAHSLLADPDGVVGLCLAALAEEWGPPPPDELWLPWSATIWQQLRESAAGPE